MPTSIIDQITEVVVKGAASGTDTLTFTALSIVQIGYTPAVKNFSASVDYRLTGGAVDWSPNGKQPQTGQSYYVTYTFQPPSSFKDFYQISDEMDVNLRALQPLASTQIGSVTRNLFIDLPATALAKLYSSISHVSDIQSLNNLSSFTGTELDDYGFNFQVTRGGLTTASGFATFSASAVATAPILIPVRTRLNTLSTTTQASVFFRTTADATIFPGQQTVTAPVEAEQAGAIGNVGSGTIVIMTNTVLGISSVTNQDPTSGGTDSESDSNYATRILDSFLANDAVTSRGIRRRAKEFANVTDALVVGAGDALLQRGGGGGGKVDLYIQATTGIDRAQSQTTLYAGSNILLANQPVISVSSVFNNTTSTDITATSFLVKDVGLLADSVQAADAVMIGAGASNGDSLTIAYVSNGLLEDIQTFFAVNEENAVPARDFLARAATEVFIDVGVSVSIAASTTYAAVNAAIINAVSAYIDNLGLGATVVYKDVYDLIANTTGVTDVKPLTLLTIRGNATAQTISLAKNQFPQAGDITVSLI